MSMAQLAKLQPESFCFPKTLHGIWLSEPRLLFPALKEAMALVAKSYDYRRVFGREQKGRVVTITTCVFLNFKTCKLHSQKNVLVYTALFQATVVTVQTEL